MASFYLGGMEMKTWTLLIFLVISLCIISNTVTIQGDIPEDPWTGLETVVQGVVRDGQTGEPIKRIMVEIVNFSDLRIFTIFTDENGFYQIQVGTGGIYRISTYLNNINYSYHNFELFTEIEPFKVSTVDIFLEKYLNNMHFYIIDEISNKPLPNVQIEIHSNIPFDGPITFIKTELNGWANLSLSPGNYSFYIEEPYFKDHYDHFELGEIVVGFLQISLDQVVSGPNSKEVFSQDLISIPPHSYAAIKMDMPRETKVWIDFDANDQLKEVRLTEEMYLEYLAKNRSISGPVENPDHISYDCISWTRGGGGQVNLWREPYYLLLINEANETVEVNDLMMKWSQGPIEDVKVEIKFFPLEESANDSNKKSSTMIYLVPILFIIILIISSIIFLYNYYRNNKD